MSASPPGLIPKALPLFAAREPIRLSCHPDFCICRDETGVNSITDEQEEQHSSSCSDVIVRWQIRTPGASVPLQPRPCQIDAIASTSIRNSSFTSRSTISRVFGGNSGPGKIRAKSSVRSFINVSISCE